MINYLQAMINRDETPTRWQNILWLLIQAKLHDAPAPNDGRYLLYTDLITGKKYFISGGFRPMWEFRGSAKGGDSADRRLRELRADHKKDWIRKDEWIEKRAHMIILKRGDGGKKTKSIPIYGLKMDWQEVMIYPWAEAFKVPFIWQYEPITLNNCKPNLKPVQIREEPTGQRAFG